jgi:hypothetical protein
MQEIEQRFVSGENLLRDIAGYLTEANIPSNSNEIDRIDKIIDVLRELSPIEDVKFSCLDGFKFADARMQWYAAVNVKASGMTLDISEPKFHSLKALLDFYWCLSPTSAECERLFSLMNRIHTKARSSLPVKRVRDLMHLRSVALPYHLLDFVEYTRAAHQAGFGARKVTETKKVCKSYDQFRLWKVTQKSIRKPRM